MVSSTQLLKALKDPVSYGKFIAGDQNQTLIMGASNGIGVINDKNSEKSLKAIQGLLKAQLANQRVPIQFVKNDFKREKIAHNEIENRINNTNNISKELNRVAEDFRATLFNITNIREFDEKVKSLMQSDINDLLNTQRELTLAESQRELTGNSIKRISYIQEKMYKVMEKIQHHFVVQQDIKKKEKKQNIVINVNNGINTNPSLANQSQGPSLQSNGFIESLFQYLGIKKAISAVSAGAAARGAATAKAIKNAETAVAKNSASLRRFLKKHPFISKLHASGFSIGKVGKLGAVVGSIIAACVVGVYSLDESSYNSLLGKIGKSLSTIAGYVRESFFGVYGNSMKDFYEHSNFMSGGAFSSDHPARALRSFIFHEGGFRLAQAGSFVSAGAKYGANLIGYGLGKGYDKIIGDRLKKLGRNRALSKSATVKNIDSKIEALQKTYLELLNNEKYANTHILVLGGQRINYLPTVDKLKISNQIDELYSKKERLYNWANNLKPREKVVFQRNVVLRQMASKVSVLGAAVGGVLAIEDIVNFFSIEIDQKIKHSIDILNKDRKRFKRVSNEKWKEICSEIIDNMLSARKWWMATIIESISLAAINIGVGASTIGVGLVVSVFVSVVIDALFRWIRDWWLGFDFDLIDFDNPYTFINQKKLVDLTSVAFLITGTGIDIANIKEKWKKNSNEAAMALSNNNLVHTTKGIASKIKEFDDNITIDESIWNNTKISISTCALIVCLISFVNGRNINTDAYKKIKIDSKHTVGDVYENLSSNVASTGSYYPITAVNTQSILNPFNCSEEDISLRNIIKNNSGNNGIKNIVSVLNYLWSVANIFYSKKNSKIISELKSFEKDSSAQQQGIYSTNSLSHDFLSLHLIINSGFTNLNQIESSLKSFVNPLCNMLKDPYSMSLPIKNELTKIIKNYTLAYLVYIRYLEIRKLDDKCVESNLFFSSGPGGASGKDIAIGKLKLLVTILRSENDWNTIWNYYKNNIGNLITSLTNTSKQLYIEQTFGNLIIGNKSEYNIGNEAKEIEFGDNQSISNAVDTMLKNKSLENYIKLDKDAEERSDIVSKLDVATQINQKIMEYMGFKDRQNPTVNYNVAKMVFDYYNELGKLTSEELKEHYNLSELPKLNTLEDVKNNYLTVYNAILKYEGNEKIIKELYSYNPDNISKDNIAASFSKLQIARFSIESMAGMRYRDKETRLIPDEAINNYKDNVKIFNVGNRNFKISTEGVKINEGGDGDDQGSVKSNTNFGVSNNSQFNISSALDTATNGAKPRSIGRCAEYVRKAVSQGLYGTENGITFGHAYEWANERTGEPSKKFRNAGFVKINPSNGLLPGDIGVIPRTHHKRKDKKNGGVKTEYGHVQIWNGKQWISDYIQRPGKNGPYIDGTYNEYMANGTYTIKNGLFDDQQLYVFRHQSQIDNPNGAVYTPINIPEPINRKTPTSTQLNDFEMIDNKQNTQSPVIVNNQLSQSDMENDFVKNDDGIANDLFINDIVNDIIFGCPAYCI